MAKNREEEKEVDAEIGKAENAEEVTEEEAAEVLTTQDTPEPEEKKDKKSRKDKVMEVGRNVPTVAGPSVVMVNRAAIIYLAKHLLVAPDLADFKTAFPSLF